MKIKHAGEFLIILIVALATSCSTKPQEDPLIGDSLKPYEVTPAPAASAATGNIIGNANLYNYTLENLVSITQTNNLVSYNSLIDLIFNQVKIEDIQDETLKDNYGKLLVALGKLSNEAERRDFEKEIAPLQLQSEMYSIEGDMMGIFAFHQDPLGLQVGVNNNLNASLSAIGPMVGGSSGGGISFNPGAIIGQKLAWNYLAQCKANNKAAAQLKHLVEQKTQDFNSRQESKKTVMNLKIDLFKARSDYANRHEIPSGFIYTEEQLNLLLGAQSLPHPYDIHKMESHRVEFNSYPPYHVYLGVAYAQYYLTNRDPQIRQKALAEFDQYDKAPVAIYKRDPYRYSLLIYKSAITTGKENAKCLNELEANYLLYCRDYHLYFSLIKGFIQAKEYQQARRVVAQLDIFAQELRDTNLNCLLSMAKLELNAEEEIARSKPDVQTNYALLYGGRAVAWNTINDLRKACGTNAKFVTLIAPLIYQFYNFPHEKGELAHSIRWRDNGGWHSVCFNLPFKKAPGYGLTCGTDTNGITPTFCAFYTNHSRVYFDDASSQMRQFYRRNMPEEFMLMLGDRNAADTLEIGLQFDPRTNPFTYQILGIKSANGKVEFTDSRVFSSERFYEDESHPRGLVYDKWAYDKVADAAEENTFEQARNQLALVNPRNIEDRELKRYYEICRDIADFCITFNVQRSSEGSWKAIAKDLDFVELAKRTLLHPINTTKLLLKVKNEYQEFFELDKKLVIKFAGN